MEGEHTHNYESMREGVGHTDINRKWSHLYLTLNMYADVLIFAEANPKSLRTFKELLETFSTFTER